MTPYGLHPFLKVVAGIEYLHIGECDLVRLLQALVVEGATSTVQGLGEGFVVAAVQVALGLGDTRR